MKDPLNIPTHRRGFVRQAAAFSLLASCASDKAGARAPRFRPDGASVQGRLGVLTPHFDPVPESELGAMAPDGLSVHGARLWVKGDPRALSEGPEIDEAAAMFVAPGGRAPVGLAPRAILLAFATTSYLLGRDGAAKLRKRLEAAAGGTPVIMTGDAADNALRRLGAQKIALVLPPWFSSVEQSAAYFRSGGFDVVKVRRMEPERTFQEVPAAEVFSYLSEVTPREADAVFVGGNGMRVAGAIEALEAHLGRPVLSANQVLLWQALEGTDLVRRVTGYGQIFAR